MAEKTILKQRAEACLEAFQRFLPQCNTVEEAFERAAKEPTKAAMVDELHRRWKARGAKHYVCLYEIVEEPAPSFYISPSRFRRLVYLELRSKRKKDRNGGDKKKN